MAPTEQSAPLKQYRVVNEDDLNCDFLVEAVSYEDAVKEALTCLGWFVAIPEDETPDDGWS
jgi:hypothetical protein